MSRATIAAIILTFNEEIHIARCIKSLRGVCDDIFVVDSFSSDQTVSIAESLGATVYQNGWVNHAVQFNWAIANCQTDCEWFWRIDADEYLDGGLGEAVKQRLKDVDSDVNGVYVRKRIDFMGRPLLHGGWYPVNNLKLIRRGFGDCETRWMDEHLRIFEGRTIEVLNGDQVDYNLNDLTWWTQKHNGYATREMIDLLMMEYDIDTTGTKVTPKFFGTDEQRKRWLKIRYVKFPLFMRPFVNFFIRYILKAGFLDGKEGFIWHFLQGFWYRFLVDAKIYELKRELKWNDAMILNYINTHQMTCDNSLNISGLSKSEGGGVLPTK